MLTISLLRHGQVDERPYVLWGQLDPPVNARGWRDMQQAVSAPAEAWAGIVSSPLQRCRRFAEDLAREQALPLQIEPRLMELHSGEWQGRSVADLCEQDAERYRAFTQDGDRIAPPGGESLADFRMRVFAALDDWRAQARDGHWLCVTHGGVLRVVLHEWLGLQQHWRVAVPPATMLRFALFEQGDPVLLSLNSPGIELQG